jgi:uncharacterized phage-associated protein
MANVNSGKTQSMGTSVDMVPDNQLQGSRLMAKTSSAMLAESIMMSAGIPQSQDIAKALIRLAAFEEEPDHLTHLRLQKLMYYVQGWSLSQRGRPAFAGRIEAWAHGPVVKELYSLLSTYGSNPIPLDALSDASGISDEDLSFVASVWDAYKGFTAFGLREMTHRETPWIVARGNAAPADACSNEITHEAMRSFFIKQAG